MAGTLVVNVDGRIEQLVQMYIEENGKKKTMEGFRVQIFSESGNEAKKRANDTKTLFLSQFQDYPAYLLFQTPNFKVRVGDFRSKLEAYRCMKQISLTFPNTYVVSDDVQLPPVD